MNELLTIITDVLPRWEPNNDETYTIMGQTVDFGPN